MKKLMIACAAALAAFTAAQAAEVSSANIVGTQTITLGVGYNMLAANFQITGATGEALGKISIQDLIPESEWGKLNGRNKNQKIAADQLMVWSAAADSYTTYYLQKASGAITGWAYYDAVGDHDANSLADGYLELGDAVWFNNKASAPVEITIGGEVYRDDAAHSFAGGTGSIYTMMGSAFPVTFKLNTGSSIDWSSTDVNGRNKNQKIAADQIMVWSNADDGYVTYYLQKSSGHVTGWAYYDPTGDFKADDVNPDAEIPAGAGAWFVRKNGTAFSIEEPTPVPVPLAD